ncbi:MAG: hypothetical protein CL912_02220 [Deltaproteobacteria bacterium]|nr:hypothetical protein [Deltaproteobacteria bacterium]
MIKRYICNVWFAIQCGLQINDTFGYLYFLLQDLQLYTSADQHKHFPSACIEQTFSELWYKILKDALILFYDNLLIRRSNLWPSQPSDIRDKGK